MIITSKEYPVLWKSITEFSYTQNNIESGYKILKYLVEYFCNDNTDNINNKNIEYFKNTIDTQSWEDLPEIDLSKKDYAANVLHQLSNTNFLILQKNFKIKNIDFILELQKINKSLLVSRESVNANTFNTYNKKFYERSKFFINLVINNDYIITNNEQHSVFKTLLDRLVKTYQKDTHKDTLALLYKAIKLNYPSHEVLNWLKDFLQTNSSIHQNANHIFSNIKKEIKYYDLDKYFTALEIKDLYANENTGFYIKKLESMICELDINVIASNHNQASILEINKNFKILEQMLVKHFKDEKDFSGSTPTITDPKIILRFMFEKGTLYKYESVIENLIEIIASYPKLVDSSHIETLVSSTFLGEKLENNLPNKPLVQNKKKI